MAAIKDLTPYEAKILEVQYGTNAVELSFRGKVPTTNNAYFSMFTKAKRMIRVPTAEHRAFKEHVESEVRRLRKEDPRFDEIWRGLKEPGFFRFVITLYIPFFTKTGKVRRYDASNRVKLPEDAFMDLLEIDDTNVIEAIGQKLDRSQGDFPDEQYYWSVRIKRMGETTMGSLVELKEQERAAKVLEGGYTTKRIIKP